MWRNKAHEHTKTALQLAGDITHVRFQYRRVTNQHEAFSTQYPIQFAEQLAENRSEKFPHWYCKCFSHRQGT
jgi:hypothetical protein